MRTRRAILGRVWAAALLCVAPSAVHAGTKFQTTLVPNVAGANGGFSAKGSSVKLDGSARALKGKIKGVVDGAGMRVTTDDMVPADNYSVEVDISNANPATPGTSTLTVSFDLSNGNGKFTADLTTDPVYAAAAAGDGIAVTGVRVKDSTATVIGVGGIAK